MIYLDNNATTRPAAEAIDAVTNALHSGWANPSSSHGAGQAAARAIEEARGKVSRLINVDPNQIVFASGATEANEGILRHYANLGRDIVVSEADHPAVAGYFIQRFPNRTHFVGIKKDGSWDLDDLERVLSSSKTQPLIAFGWAHGETGVLQDVYAIGTVANRFNAPCLVDGSQVVGRIPITAASLPFGHLTFSGHKLHGPKGIGALVNIGSQEEIKLLIGGGQESGRRGGTENVPGIAGFGAACEIRAENLPQAIETLTMLRDRFEGHIARALSGVQINGVEASRVPNTCNITFSGVDGMALVARLEAGGVICSQVSACSSGAPEPSRALMAMGLSRDDAFSSIRFAISVDNTVADIDCAAQLVVEEAEHLRDMMGV